MTHTIFNDNDYVNRSKLIWQRNEVNALWLKLIMVMGIKNAINEHLMIDVCGLVALADQKYSIPLEVT